MSFENIKQQNLKELEQNNQGTKDKSKKGFVDEEIKALINLINANKNYYTTSSCAGRIVILLIKDKTKKHETEWLLSSHQYVKKVDETIIKKIRGDCWIKFEPCIIHVCCKDLPSAITFIDAAKQVGFKRGGICSISKDNRIIVEVSGVDRIDVPIANEQGLLVSEEYLNFLLQECNKKMEKNSERIKRFYQLCKKL